MKRNDVPKSVLVLWISGLLLTTCMPLLGNVFSLPGLAKGFIGGVGIGIELIALVKLRRIRKGAICAASTESRGI